MGVLSIDTYLLHLFFFSFRLWSRSNCLGLLVVNVVELDEAVTLGKLCTLVYKVAHKKQRIPRGDLGAEELVSF